MAAVKITPADKYFSLCVRERAGGACECCGKSTDRLECSHIFSRRHRTIRWSGDNAEALCHWCHRQYHENPLDGAARIRNEYGDGHLDLLREKMNCKVKVPKAEEKAIAAHYREQHKQQLAHRAAGEIGRIEFESYQ